MGALKDIFSKIFGFGRKSKIKKDESTFRGECGYCFKKLSDVGRGFCCRYCGEWHCIKHRLPEDHECSGSPQNPHMG